MDVIVDPDFLDHWRTRMLVDALQDEMAPLYVLRVWTHCQNRKTTTFDGMPPEGLKALCRYVGEAQKLEAAMIAAGFIVRNGDAIEAPKWSEHNAKLVANWTNGAGGGRPPKEPKPNPPKTQQEPTGTQAEPIREDKSREEQPPSLPGKPGSAGKGRKDYPDDFEAVWAIYPKRVGDNPKRDAFHAWNARLREGVDAAAIYAGVQRYAAFLQAAGKVGTEYVKQAATFFGPNRAFDEAWAAPVNGKAKPWFIASGSAIEAKARELGIDMSLPYPELRLATFKAAGITREMEQKALKEFA